MDLPGEPSAPRDPREPPDDASASVPDDRRIRTAFVDAARGIDTPHGDPVAAEVLVDVGVADGMVEATVDLSGLADGVANRVGEQLRGSGLAIDGVEHVRIESANRRRTGESLGPDGVDAILAVGGAKGGVGKSTVTVTLARALEEAGLDVGIFDADVQAPDVSEILGIDEPIAATATGSPAPATVDGIQVVSIDLVTGDRPIAWRGAMVHDVLADLLGSAAWDDRDVLLVDLPPGLGDVADAVFTRVPVDGAFLVTTPASTSVRNVKRTAGLLEAHGVPTVAVAENMVDAVTGPDQSGEHAVADLLDASSGAPRHVRVPFDRALQRPAATDADPCEETGEAIDALASAATEHLATAVATIPEPAVDLSGLPSRLREQQAVLEVGATPDDPPPLVVDGNDDVPAILSAEFGADLSVSALGDDRRLVRVGGDPS